MSTKTKSSQVYKIEKLNLLTLTNTITKTITNTITSNTINTITNIATSIATSTITNIVVYTPLTSILTTCKGKSKIILDI